MHPELMCAASCPVPACARAAVLPPSSPTHRAEYVAVLGSPVTKGTCQVPLTQSYGSIKGVQPRRIGAGFSERSSSKPHQLDELEGACCLRLPCVTSGLDTRCGSIR